VCVICALVSVSCEFAGVYWCKEEGDGVCLVHRCQWAISWYWLGEGGCVDCVRRHPWALSWCWVEREGVRCMCCVYWC
jgi:hypothetical protein